MLCGGLAHLAVTVTWVAPHVLFWSFVLLTLATLILILLVQFLRLCGCDLSAAKSRKLSTLTPSLHSSPSACVVRTQDSVQPQPTSLSDDTPYLPLTPQLSVEKRHLAIMFHLAGTLRCSGQNFTLGCLGWGRLESALCRLESEPATWCHPA